MGTQWAAQFLVAAELERRGYVVSFTMGHATPVADLMVGHPDGRQFWVDVKGLQSKNAWMGTKKAPRDGLFYVLVFVGSAVTEDQYFVVTQSEWDHLIDDYQNRHPNQKKIGGFGWPDPAIFKACWAKLPGWEGLPAFIVEQREEAKQRRLAAKGMAEGAT